MTGRLLAAAFLVAAALAGQVRHSTSLEVTAVRYWSFADTTRIAIEITGDTHFRADRAEIDGGFFNAAGMAIVAGRTFNDGDRRDGPPVAIISQAMARRYWPEGNALGRILRRPGPAQADVMIVGVANDINIRSLGEAPRDVIYLPYTQGGGAPATLGV